MSRKLVAVALTMLTAVAVVTAEQPVRKRVVRDANISSTLVTIDANQLDMFVTNEGNFAYDIPNIRGKADGLYFPNSYPVSDKTLIYDAGLWIGGVRDGDTRISVAEYSSQFTPGAIGTDPDLPGSRVYKIYKDHLQKVADGFMVQDKNLVNGSDPNASYPLTADDYNGWVAAGGPVGADGTPWINELGADQMTFSIFNDVNPGPRSAADAGSPDPVGVTIKQTTFAFNRSDALGNVIFMRYEVIYDPAATDTLRNAYMSLWADPDMGGAGDDFVGCDPEIGLGYCYNATNNDNAYGSAPPAVGFDFFQGPTNTYGIEWPPNSGTVPQFLPMTSFNKYINGTDPHSVTDTYNYMQGLNLDGTPLENGTTYQVPGDPVSGEGELDTDPADRRFMLSAGPFYMAPGDTNVVVAAVVAAQGTNRLSSVTFMRYVDTFAQSAFDAGFSVPQPPAIPSFTTVSEMPNKVSLVWDGAAQDNPGNYAFQGYNIWQGATSTGPWMRIATYDEVDGIATIFQEAFDPETGEIYSQPLQFGTDAGVKRHIEITADAFTWNGNTGLVNNHPYYFAVSAYSYDPAEVPNNLESAKVVVTVVPNAGPNGRDWAGITTDSGEFEHSAGGSDGFVSYDVIDESRITGHTYTVSYYDTTFTVVHNYWDTDDNDNPIILPTESEVAESWWRVTDTTTGDVKANGPWQNNGLGRQYYQDLNGDGAVDIFGLFGDPETITDSYPVYDAFPVDYPVGAPYVDGIRLEPNGPPLLGASAVWTPDDGTSSRWLTGINNGLELLGGGLGLGVNFRGSNVPPAGQKKVRVVLTPDEDLWSDAAVYDRLLNGVAYAYVGIGQFPGYVEDIEDPANPRRLNVTFVERNSELPANMFWDPRDASTAGREYLFINDSDYNGGVDYNQDNHGTNTDVLWAWWPTMRAGFYDPCDDPTAPECFLENLTAHPGQFVFTPNYVNTPDDVFTLATSSFTQRQSGKTLATVRAVPNPYYGRSSYETKADVKVVKFTNLPANATVKIFNIAGDHVRTLQTTAGSTTYELPWNLKNESNIYVASGVYVYFVEAPGYGESFGKVAVFLEEERLKDY